MIYLISALAFILDLLSKQWILNNFSVGDMWSITPWFNLYLVTNRGISFSMFTAQSSIGTWMLVGMTLAICVGLIYFIQHEKKLFSKIALAMVLGGALGNIYDRIRYGAVIDFLDFHWENHHFPAFNIADSCISIGVGLLLIQMVLKEKK